MKKYLLLSAIVLFSSSSHAVTPPKAFADSNTSAASTDEGWKPFWWYYNKAAQDVTNEIPTLLRNTLDQYPEFEGNFKFDIESIQVSLSISMEILEAFAYHSGATRKLDRYILEMDVIHTESGNIMKLNCPINALTNYSTGSVIIYFFTKTFFWNLSKTCTLTSQDEMSIFTDLHFNQPQEEATIIPIFTDPSSNPHHEFQRDL